MLSKKGQVKTGMVTGLVFGIASLVIGVIIAFVIVSTLTGAGLFTKDSNTVSVEEAYVNGTTYTLSGASADHNPTGFTVISIVNASDGVAIVAANYSLGSTTGILINTTSNYWNFVNISYTYSTDSINEQAVDNLEANFTAGVDNVSAKVPTVLLVAAIVLILGVLAVLVGVWQRMRIGGGSL